ncbi:MAG: hypothetical protein ACRDXC_08245 [Acidimicrobiales bacterium]
MAVLIWPAAVLWIAALMVVATGGLVTDTARRMDGCQQVKLRSTFSAADLSRV